MEYVLKMTKGDLQYVCKQIGGKHFKKLFLQNPVGFNEIKKGYRVNALTDSEAVDLAENNANKLFISRFVDEIIEKWMTQIQEAKREKEKEGNNRLVATMLTLPDSFFAEKPDIFFKLSNDKYTENDMQMVKAACLVSTNKIYHNVDDSKSVADKKDEEQENSWRIARDQYIQDIDDLKRIVQEKDACIDGMHDLIEKQEEKNVSVSKELDELKKMAIEYAPKRTSLKNEKYPYTSLCKVEYDYEGRMRLNRISDIDDGSITDKYIADFPIYNRLFTKEKDEEEGAISVWDWGTEPNNNDPSKDFIVSVRNEDYLPIEVIFFENYDSLDNVVNEITTGFSYDNMTQRLFVCIHTSERKYKGVLCKKSDFDNIAGLYKLKHNIYQLPVYELLDSDFVILENKRKIVKFFNLGLPEKMEYVKDPLEIVRTLFVKRINWSGMKQAEFSRTDYQKFRSFIDTLITKDLYQEVADACQCGYDEAGTLVNMFAEKAKSYLSAKDIESESFARIIRTNVELMDACKKEMDSEWKIENAEKISRAGCELREIEDDINRKNAEVKKLQTQNEALKKQLEEELSDIEQKKKFAEDVDKNVKEKIEKAKDNAAEFIAEMAFQSANQDTYSQKSVENSASCYTEGTALNKEMLENNNTVGDLLMTLQYELVDEGVAEEYALWLAAYLYSAYINHVAILISGPCAKEIADALSVSLFGRTAGELVLGGNYSENVIENLDPDDKIVILENAFNPYWNKLFQSLHAKKDKLFIAVTPYLEDAIMEPRSMTDYFIPLYTGLFIDKSPNGNYVGGYCNPDLLAIDETTHVTNNKLLQSVTLSLFARSQISRVLNTMHQVNDNKMIDGDILFCILPILILQKQHSDIEEYIDALIADGADVTTKTLGLIKEYLGKQDE